VAKQVELAEKDADQKFGTAYERLAADRKHADEALAGAVQKLNDNLAKQAALADSRFEKTVEDIENARKQAAADVTDMRKDFAVRLIAVKATVGNIQQKLVGEIGKVSGESISLKANQIRVNRRVKKEMKRVEALANKRFSESKRARGQLRQLMDENKQAASLEVKALEKELMVKIDKADAKNAANKKEMAKDLTDATEKFYEKRPPSRRPTPPPPTPSMQQPLQPRSHRPMISHVLKRSSTARS